MIKNGIGTDTGRKSEMGKKGRSFGGKLYSMFMRSILIMVFIAVLSFLIYSMNVMAERQERNAQNILNSVSQNLELQFAEIAKVRDAFYIHKEVFQEAERLNNPQLYRYYDELTQIEIEKAYTTTLTKLLHTSSQNIRAVVFFPESGEEAAYYLGKNSAEIRDITYEGYKDTVWYQEAVQNPESAVYCAPHTPEYMVNKKLGKVYSCVSAVRSMDTRKVIGVIKIDIDSRQLLETLNTLEKTDENGLVLLKDGAVFARSEEPAGEVEEIEEGKIRIGSRVYRTKTLMVPGTDFELACLDSDILLYRGYLYIVIFTVGIVLGGVVLAFVNYRYQAAKMVEDVEQITSVIQRVEKGELDVHINIRADSEFGKIAEVINQMIDHLQEYIEKEYVLVIQNQKAQYQALQSQINPHFLYNTLNGFVALNRMGEKKTLERSIIGLSKLFRYACSKAETASVQEELSFLEEYLKLEKLKYEERLSYLIWIDEACKTKRIPKLLLQPIVENSIKHGMGDTDRPIMIQITAAYAENPGMRPVMVLTVRDNGAGFDVTGIKTPEDHVGMDNVRMRAELYCRDVIYQCVSRPGEGTRTTFVFPDENQGG